MTSRERLDCALRGGLPDRVPVSPFGWGHIDPDSALAAEMLHQLDMILSVGGGGSPFFGAGAPIASRREGDDTITVFHTPYGDLTQVHRRTAITSATVDFACRDADDLAKILAMEHTFAPPDAAPYHAWCERAGEDALVMVGLSDAICTPATLMSPEDLCYCWADDPQALIALTNVAHQRAMRHLEALCEQGVKAFRIIGGEYATTQLGPAGFEALCLHQDRELCALMRSYGAISYYHNHGPVMRYLELFRAVGMDAIDPFEGPPYGDADLTECRRVLGDICIVGNLDDMEQYEKLSHDRLRELAAERLQATGARARVLGGTASGTYTEVGVRGFMALVEVAEGFGQG
jgi:hypothetical protein